MIILIAIILFILGAVFGSFVGAMSWRMRHHKDWVRGRSECEHCHHKLAVLDLIPVVSWVSLGGKCRYCKKSIGWTALLLELFEGMAFAASFFFLPIAFGGFGGLGTILDAYTPAMITTLAVWLIAVVIMTALLVYDACWHVLPNKLVFPLIAVASVFSLVNYLWIQQAGLGQWGVSVLLGMLPITGVYGVLWLISRGEWVGLGDVKLGIAIGLLLPWQQGLMVLALANILGTLVVLPQLLGKKLKATSQIPFGPYLIIATYFTMLFGAPIVSWLAKNFFLIG